MTERKFIIAGSHVQYIDYVNKKGLLSNTKHYQYVSSVDSLRGYHNPRGVFIGTWYDKPDILDIIYQLMIANQGGSEALLKARNIAAQRKWGLFSAI
jgi:hypothetical protein